MIVCFDIGGTSVKGGIAFSARDIQPFQRRPTPLDDFEAFVATLRAVLDESGGTPDCISIAIAGVLDPESGLANIANIPCLNGRALAANLESALGLPVLVANDADCFAVAEASLGAGRGHRIVFGAILGTGIGGGLVIDGALINRNGGFAGEWGHGPVAATLAGNPPVELPRFQCGCGLKGCLDAVCGARGLERLHTHLHAHRVASEEILSAWEAGDAEATRTVEIMIDIMASPLALVVNVTGATIVPVGGGLSKSVKLLESVDHAVRSRTIRQFENRLVVPAQCKVEPGLVGAALLGFQYSASTGL